MRDRRGWRFREHLAPRNEIWWRSTTETERWRQRLSIEQFRKHFVLICIGAKFVRRCVCECLRWGSFAEHWLHLMYRSFCLSLCTFGKQETNPNGESIGEREWKREKLKFFCAFRFFFFLQRIIIGWIVLSSAKLGSAWSTKSRFDIKWPIVVAQQSSPRIRIIRNCATPRCRSMRISLKSWRSSCYGFHLTNRLNNNLWWR